MASRPWRDPAVGLAELREEMDQLNARLRDTLQERARLALRIARFKQAHGLPQFDAAREREMIARMLRRHGRGHREVELAAIFRSVFKNTRALFRRELGRGGR